MDREPVDTSELILDLVDSIPEGRVTTYGTLAQAVRLLTGKGSARQVGQVLSRSGATVPWWRVVNASGECAQRLQERQRQLLVAEGITVSSVSQRYRVTSRDWWWPAISRD